MSTLAWTLRFGSGVSTLDLLTTAFATGAVGKLVGCGTGVGSTLAALADAARTLFGGGTSMTSSLLVLG